MSLALIQESAKEVRRLAVAGSSLAVGDFRLKKLATPLEQAGAKVPVFAQVAKAINDLVNGPEAESAARLLSLSTLLNAILYTQGQTGAQGDMRQLESFPTKCNSTRTTARVLKPLVQALTSSGGGRFEIVKAACERNAFNDLRLIDATIQALGDSFPELADLVADKVLPSYGPGIVPRLKKTLDLKGKRLDARKLSVIHRLDPQGALELCKSALEDGSVDVKAAAIGCLGKHEECLPLLLEQAKAKNKQLRAEALQALAAYERAEVSSVFIELIKGKALDVLAGPFRAMRNSQVLEALLSEGKRVFDLVAKGESEQIARFWEILDCLQTRREAEVEAFLHGCFAAADKLGKVKAAQNSVIAGADIQTRLSQLLCNIGSPKALEAVLEKRETLPAAAFPQIFQSAVRVWPAEKVFTEFSPLLGQGKGGGKEKSEHLQRVIAAAHWDAASRFNPGIYFDEEIEEEQLRKVSWDPRWLDAAIEGNHQTMVCCLARPNHKAALKYLLKAGEAKKTSEAGLTIQALVRCQYPEVTNFFIELVKKKTKGAKYYDYELQFLFENARHLPAADLPKLDEFAAKLDEKFVDHFLEAIAPLRPTTTQTA